jgi:hypothetical protein
MKLKVKEEFIEGGLYCPLRKVEVAIKLIESDMYQYYFDKGYSHIFETEKPIIQKTNTKSTKSTDIYDLPE